MKKLIVFALVASLAAGISSCKKKDDNGNPTPSVSCKLKGSKGQTNNSADDYDGFVLVYDGNKISRVNIIDSLGNENSGQYVLLSYNGNNITDVKIYEDNAEMLHVELQYDNNNRIKQRSFEIDLGGQTVPVVQKYFYDAQGRIDYVLRTVSGTIGPVAFTQTDSAKYVNYITQGRPGTISVYQTTTTPQGTDPYELTEEFFYEYDANGNRTKESKREGAGNPINVTRAATYDAVKTPGDAMEAFRLLTRLFANDYEDPNPNTKDIDKNLLTLETINDDAGNSETTTTSYVFNDRGNIEKSTEVTGSDTKVTIFTYDCK